MQNLAYTNKVRVGLELAAEVLTEHFSHLLMLGVFVIDRIGFVPVEILGLVSIETILLDLFITELDDTVTFI